MSDVKEIKTGKLNFGIHKKKLQEHDLYSNTDQNSLDVRVNKIENAKLNNLKEAIALLYRLQKTNHKTDPFWFNRKVMEFKQGYICLDEIKKGKVA